MTVAIPLSSEVSASICCRRSDPLAIVGAASQRRHPAFEPLPGLDGQAEPVADGGELGAGLAERDPGVVEPVHGSGWSGSSSAACTAMSTGVCNAM